ncbi:MAG TPA: hypothetical protein DGT21_07125 [Armatimonadetes bacterium]|jgi:arabinose-5-phosphate isomerase|nr:hypothetical protein [Armatimonadota bacterium]
MDTSEILNQARTTIAIETDAISRAADRLGEDFIRACRMILESPGRTVLCGIGKSGAVARKLAGTFASTGTPAFFLHPAEAIHGDLGMVCDADIVIMLSNSGETDELVRILPALRRRGVRIIAVCGEHSSTLAQEAEAIIDSAIECEACPLGLAPTASTATMMALGDALAMAVMHMRGFSVEDFAASHPGGALGRRLLSRVSDAMHAGQETPRVAPSTTVLQCLLTMSHASVRGVVVVVDEAGRMQGLFTDGDLRRLMQSGENRDELMDRPVSEVMTANPVSVRPETLATEALRIMETREIDNLPVVDGDGIVAGVVDIQDLMKLRVL